MRNCLSLAVALALCGSGCLAKGKENPIERVVEVQRDDPCGVIFPCEEEVENANIDSATVAHIKNSPKPSNSKAAFPPKSLEAKLKSVRSGQPEFESFWMHSPAEKLTAAVIVESLALKGQIPSLEKRIQAVEDKNGNSQDTVFITVTVLATGAAVFGLIAAGVGFHKLRQRFKSAEEAEYPRYGITGPAKPRLSSDDKLASGAQLQHYQHTKQQIIVMTQPKIRSKEADEESEDSECEGVDADYSVFECPGLASTGNMEVNNPLFAIDGLNAAPVAPAKEG